MGIRQRHWAGYGKRRSAWVVEYRDLKGKRRLKTFKTKREAEDFRATARVDVRRGMHIAESDSITVARACELWLETGKENGLVKSSLVQCEGHVRLHINPFIGHMKIVSLTVPAVRAFESQLRDNGRSAALTKKVLVSLGGILADALERGAAMTNPVRDMRQSRAKRRTKGARERKKKLVVGVDIPTPAEIREIMGTASGFRRAFFMVAALAGLRSSELRALRWQDIDFAKSVIHVRQRADQWNNVDQTKSEAGHRDIPVSPKMMSALREWKLACPRRNTGREDADGNPVMELHYVFPNGKGRIESQQNIVKRHWHPLQIAASVSVPALDDAGNPIMELDDDGKPLLDDNSRPKPVMKAKYSGLHALRHFYCSWCAARPQDGGLGLPLKTVQVRMGHSTLAMTADTYGHLFPSQDDAEVLAAGERALMGT